MQLATSLIRLGATPRDKNEAIRQVAALLAENGVEVVVLDDPTCVAMMTDFIAANPALWNEDIGEE